MQQVGQVNESQLQATQPQTPESMASWHDQRFTPREISEIISIATRMQNEGVKGEQILQMAEEAGIASEYVEHAVVEFLKRKWQRIETEMQMRRRLKRLLLLGGVLIALGLLITWWVVVESQFNRSYATSSIYSPTPYSSTPPIYGMPPARLPRPLYASSRNLSVSVTPFSEIGKGMSGFQSNLNQSVSVTSQMIISRHGEPHSVMVQIPSSNITQVVIAPSEKRIMLYDESAQTIWVVNADGTALSQVTGSARPPLLADGNLANLIKNPFAGWNGDDLILHTEKGSVRVKLSEENKTVGVELFK